MFHNLKEWYSGVQEWRKLLFTAAITTFIVYTYALWSTDALFMNIPRYIGTVGSVIGLLLLYGLTISLAYLARRRRKGESKLHMWWASAAFVSLMVTFFATTFVIDWGAFAPLRDLQALSALPDGNLIFTGGRGGVLYLGAFVLLVVSIVWNLVRNKIKKARDRRASDPTVRRLKVNDRKVRPMRPGETIPEGVRQMAAQPKQRPQPQQDPRGYPGGDISDLEQLMREAQSRSAGPSFVTD